jgi:alanine racemase
MAVRALARVNLAALERNVARLRSQLIDGASLCAVVKGDGYGHGAVPCARAALAGGAARLAVATAQEAAELRAGGIGAPLLVMGALSAEELPVAVRARADVVAWTDRFVADAVAAIGDVAARAGGRGRPAGGSLGIHVKLDSGMGRLGTRDPAEAQRVVEGVMRSGPAVSLAGVMTHFATADGDQEFVEVQLARFEPFVTEVRRTAPGVTVHAANSAATLRVPASHFDMVRCGIAIYGADPMNDDPSTHELEPVLELSSYVAAVKRAAPGDSAGYGRQFIAPEETWLGTVPIGYADGIRRALSGNCDVLVAGRRYPLVGAVSMDNITIDLGPETTVAVGQPATIVGVDGSVRQTAEELARRIGTINYEVLTGISARVPRVYHRDGVAA